MIKTYLRRWWVLNRLFHLSKHHHGMVVPLDFFLDWMVGLDVSSRVPSWYTGTTQRGKFHEWFTRVLYNSESAKKYGILPDTQIREFKQLVSECADKKLINVISGNSIELSPAGLEQYSVSYLVFGHDYVRKIWIGVIVAVVGWFIVSQLKGIEPQIVKIQYEQSTQQVSTSVP